MTGFSHGAYAVPSCRPPYGWSGRPAAAAPRPSVRRPDGLTASYGTSAQSFTDVREASPGPPAGSLPEGPDLVFLVLHTVAGVFPGIPSGPAPASPTGKVLPTAYLCGRPWG
jgi:hypothetical protein